MRFAHAAGVNEHQAAGSTGPGSCRHSVLARQHMSTPVVIDAVIVSCTCSNLCLPVNSNERGVVSPMGVLPAPPASAGAGGAGRTLIGEPDPSSLLWKGRHRLLRPALQKQQMCWAQRSSFRPEAAHRAWLPHIEDTPKFAGAGWNTRQACPEFGGSWGKGGRGHGSSVWGIQQTLSVCTKAGSQTSGQCCPEVSPAYCALVRGVCAVQSWLPALVLHLSYLQHPDSIGGHVVSHGC